MKNQEKKVTVYCSSEFLGNINKYEGRLVDFGIKPYAQYNSAPYVSFIPKRKRKAVRILKSYKPFLIVLEGTNHPDPEDGFKKLDENWNVSKYRIGDDTGRLNFDEMIDIYIENENPKVLLDARSTKGFNSYQKNHPLV